VEEKYEEKTDNDDVNQLAKASRTTVSLVLNNVYKSISAPRCFSRGFNQGLSTQTTRVEG
jgi:hypothetical protein